MNIVLNKLGANYADFKNYMKFAFRDSVFNAKNKYLFLSIIQYYNPKNLAELIVCLKDYLDRKVLFNAESYELQKIQTPYLLIKSGTGDCKSYTLFGAVMCYYYNQKNKNEANLVGYPANPDSYTHIFNRLHLPNYGLLEFDLSKKQDIFKPSLYTQNQIIILN